MATDQRSLPAFFSTDADFQAWCQGIAAQLVIAGMVKTTDTGQINNATVVKPSSTNTASGYEIYKLSDAMQATNPYFVKIEYGSGSVVSTPALWMTAGTGTNGAGTITGPTCARVQETPNSVKTAGATLPSYVSGDGSRFLLANNCDSANAAFVLILSLDRLRDGTGTTTTDGVLFFCCSLQTAATIQTIINGTANTAIAGAGCVAGPTASTTSTRLGAGLSVVGSNVIVMPFIVAAGQMRYSMNFVVFNNNDITGNATFVANNLGSTHTYQSLVCSTGLPMSTNDRIAYLYE